MPVALNCYIHSRKMYHYFKQIILQKIPLFRLCFSLLCNKCYRSSVMCINVFSAADLSAIKAGQDAKPKKTKMGRCLGDTIVQFEKAENSSLNLVGKSKG